LTSERTRIKVVSSAQCDCQLFEHGKHCGKQVFHQMDSMRHHMVYTGQRW